MRTLIVVCAVIGVALRALALLPEPASTNAPALVFFEPDWIADNERRLFLAHLRRTLALALETVGLAWLCIGAGHHLLERAGGASSRRRALVVVLASAMVCFLARPVAAVLVGLGGPTDALVAALGTSVDASLERLPWWLIDGAVVVTVLGRWPRAGVLALWAWMSLTNVVGPNVLAVLWPMPAVGTPPPGLVQLVERHGLSSGMLRVVDGDDDAFTHNVGPAREIVLSRGWLARTTPDEQASVVAHEVGHILANDNERDAVMGLGRAALLALVMGLVLWRVRRQAMVHVALTWPLLLIVVSTADAVLKIGRNAVSHRQELRADAFSIDNVGFDAFVTQQVRTTRELRNDPAVPWIATLLYTHPDLVTRLRQAEHRSGRRCSAQTITDGDRPAAPP
jgi:hypothetical protein